MSSSIIKDSLQKAGEINLLKLDIVSTSGVRTDVSNIFVELQIFENLFSNVLTGTLMIHDKYNLINNVPLIGREIVEVKFKTPSTEEIEKKFLVTEIELNQRLPGKNETLIQIRFSSIQFELDKSTKVSKSFSNKKLSSMVASIFENYLRTDDDTLFLIQDTSPETTIVLPNWTPIQSINWIASKCSFENNCDYVFFEGMKNFYFVPISFLKTQEPSATFKYFPSVPFGSDSFLEDQFERIESYTELSDGFKKSELESEGIFSSVLITFDTTNKNLNYNSFNYIQDFASTPRLQENPIAPVSYLLPISPSNKIFFRSNSKFLHKDIEDQINLRNIQNRTSQIGRMHDKIIKIDIPGDSRRRVGEVVELLIPSTEFLPLKTSETILDESISGKYMISAIGHHIVRQDGYYMGIEMIKDSYTNPISDKVIVGGSV